MSAFSLEYTIDLDEQLSLMRVKVYGIWNEATAKNYHEDFAEEAKPLLGKPWAKLVDLTNWKTSYEGIIKIIGSHMDWSKENRAKLQIYVLDNPSTFRQLNRMIEQGDAEDITKIFRTVEEAEKYIKEFWVTELG